jgi:hypothetical protein
MYNIEAVPKKLWADDDPVNKEKRKRLLLKKIFRFSFFNFFLVALVGLFIRTFGYLPSGGINYKYILHAHSHFAFGGWVMPLLFGLILKFFPRICRGIPYIHLRNITAMIFISAYGMLFSFPFEGYAAVSISFSTLSIFAGYYLAYQSWKVLRKDGLKISERFLLAGFFYFLISSFGPFATGPLIAMGKAGSVLYFDAIYFYLHFQYNGWFTFTLLAVLFEMIGKALPEQKGRMIFRLMNLACTPACFLSFLWSHPPVIFYFVGGIGAIMQLAAVFMLLQGLLSFFKKNDLGNRITGLALIAFVIKNILQFAGAFPAVTDLAYQNRNFIIAYLHLVLLGFVSLFSIGVLLIEKMIVLNKARKYGILLFLIGFISTELLMILRPMMIPLHITGNFPVQQLLVGFTALLPVGASLLVVGMSNTKLPG